MTKRFGDRYDCAIAAIDRANADDPTTIVIKGQAVPKEPAHAEMAQRWVERLVAEPPEGLMLAARAHHIRRWLRPRQEYPQGRQGYLRWRRDLQVFHAEEAAKILRDCGYGEETLERVAAIIRKRGLGRDPEVQAFEDALSLVFLETQLHEFRDAREDAKVVEILRKAWRKMSPAAREAALGFEFDPADRRLLDLATTDERERSDT